MKIIIASTVKVGTHRVQTSKYKAIWLNRRVRLEVMRWGKKMGNRVVEPEAEKGIWVQIMETLNAHLIASEPTAS